MAHGSHYRMYLDESGNHQMDANGIANNRYLGVVGAIVDMNGYYTGSLCPAIDKLKVEHFGNDPDLRIILHREDIVGRRKDFTSLSNPGEALKFNKSLCQVVAAAQVGVIAVVIDKGGHRSRYADSAKHPYCYCAEVLMERFYFWLCKRGGMGDAMAESRGKNEDEELQAAWKGFYNSGTSHIGSCKLRQHIRTPEMKIRKKEQNIHGLQLADVIATAATDSVLIEFGKKTGFRHPLDKYLHSGFDGKYHCHPSNGTVKGYGKVFLSGGA